MTIPCIVFYIMQLFIDSFIANTWASKYERYAAAEEAYESAMAALDGSGAAAGVGEAQLLSGKVAAKLSAGGGTAAGTDAGGEQLIGTAMVLAGGAARPSRGALLNRRQSSLSDGGEETAGLMQSIELNDVNPMAQGNSQQGALQQPGSK
jgi:hypothetical protein